MLGREREQAPATAESRLCGNGQMGKGGRDRGRGRLCQVTSGLRDEIWKEHTPFELDGEHLYEAHDCET